MSEMGSSGASGANGAIGASGAISLGGRSSSIDTMGDTCKSIFGYASTNTSTYMVAD